MGKMIIFALAVLSVLVMPHAHADTRPWQDDEAQAPPAMQRDDDQHARPARTQRGTLYRIRHHGNTAYLFGTIHVGKEEFFPLNAEATQAFSRAGKLAVELDVRDSATFRDAIGKHGLYAHGETIDNHLSADSLRQLRRVLRQADLPFWRIARMKPWLVANVLVSAMLEREGYLRSHGAESFLLAQAQAQSKSVLELESAEYQLSLYDSMTPGDQERYLLENLKEIENGSAMKNSRAMIEAWASGDSSTFEDFVRQSHAERTLASDFILKVLLGKRNPDMASKVEALLLGETTSFISVGFLHLVGDAGLPTLLRERGYAVEKIY
jgi:uncharacterized protein YbaP (TraB family)